MSSGAGGFQRRGERADSGLRSRDLIRKRKAGGGRLKRVEKRRGHMRGN